MNLGDLESAEGNVTPGTIGLASGLLDSKPLRLEGAAYFVRILPDTAVFRTVAREVRAGLGIGLRDEALSPGGS